MPSSQTRRRLSQGSEPVYSAANQSQATGALTIPTYSSLTHHKAVESVRLLNSIAYPHDQTARLTPIRLSGNAPGIDRRCQA